MARPLKTGLDYFELDCQLDEKIELIEAEYGLKGFAIVIKLYQSIYAGLGYYCEWTPDISVLWARRLGLSRGGDFGDLGMASKEGSLPGYPKNLINDVVAASIRRGIFSKELFDKYHILTSEGIQKRYLNATSRREKVDLKKEYLLVSVGKKMKNVVINGVSVNKNLIDDNRNKQRSKDKSIKKDISKEISKKSAETAPPPASLSHTKPEVERASKQRYGQYKRVLLTGAELQKLCEEYGKELTEEAISIVDNWAEKKNVPDDGCNWYSSLKKWGISAAKKERKERNKQQTQQSNSFNNMQMHSDYNMDELEKAIMSN